ncbi:hypothetical protein [Nonomuraea sp. NPDC050540]|uniref:hypothetical protein n=1 Tax=Nonomuraea sp. NPDC050540 TaxID=3364367 RepID=UPI0037B3B1F4
MVDGGGRHVHPWPKLAIWECGRYRRPADPGPEAVAEPEWLPDAFAVYRHALQG